MNVSQYFLRVASRAKSVSSALEDYELLAAIRSAVSPEKNKSQNTYQDEIFSYQEERISDLRTLCTVSERCGGVWTVREGVDWLLFYIFYRRYGWDEAPNQQLVFQVYVPSVSHRVRAAAKDDEMRFKERIVAVSSDLIAWLEQHQLYLIVIKMYNSAIRIARSTNVTRSYMIHHTLRWISRSLETSSGAVNSPIGHRKSFYSPVRPISGAPGTTPHSPFLPEDATPETMYMAVKDLIILCATDSLHKIRQAVIPLIGRLLNQLSLNTCLRLLDSIIEIFNRQEVTSWEAAEGYLNLMGLLIKRVVACNPDDEMPPQGNLLTPLSNVAPYGPSTISVESFQKDLLPRIKLIVFNLFDHSHSSVRIGAVNLYITCLKRCPQAVIQTALDEIMNEVCVIRTPNGGEESMSPSLGANATESLLSICKILLRLMQRSGGIPLPPSTGELQNSLIQTYLGHADTNVRIAACQVYETLIYSALNNPHRIRYLLTKVMENWAIKQDVLLAPLHKVPVAMTGPGGSMIINAGNMANWYEGRLRIYQAVCRMLLQKHLTAVCDTLIRTSDSDSGVSSQDEVFSDGPRVHRNTVATPTRKTTVAPRRSILYETGPAADLRATMTQMDEGSHSRRNSGVFSFNESLINQPPTKGLIGSRILLPNLLSKKNSSAVNSILDRIRSMDDNEKGKLSDISRASTWRTEIAKRLSMAAGKSTAKTSTPNQTEGEPTRMRVLFANFLHASTECLVAEPRELRQCARKAFPETARLFRWLDANLTMEFLTMHLVQPPTLMTYACLKLLRASLKEFSQYERRYFANQEQPMPESSSHQAFLEKTRQSSSEDSIPDTNFLNCPLIRGLFNSERSIIWLSSCQDYLAEDSVPTFISLPAVDCVIITLSLAHLMPQFTHAVQWTESMQQQPASSTNLAQPLALFGDKGSNNLAIDIPSLLGAVHALVSYVRGFEVYLDDRFQPSTTTGEHARLGALRPFCNRRQRELRGSGQCQPPLATFLTHLISSMEDVLFHYLPPSPNPPRPGALTRFTAGQLLLPMLLPIITWPLALLPPMPTEASTPYSEKYELRILSVRRLLRLIAAIVHALPLANEQTPLNADPNSLAAHMETRNRGRIDLTVTVNSYFAQLEKILTQLREACSPVALCQSSSWWWFRALCEHMPRFMLIAPHANPVTLIRLLLDEVGKSGNRAMARVGNAARPRQNISPRAVMRWAKAIEYARGIAASRISAKQPKAVFAYRWPTVGVLLRSKSQIETISDQLQRERLNTDTILRGRTSCNCSGLDGDEELVVDNTQDGAFLDRKNSAFDSMIDDEQDLVIDPAECDTSSGEENSIEFDADGRKRANTITPRRKRTGSNNGIKAQAIETPPPFTDVVGLVKRIWPLCQPVTIGTLKTLLSANELSLITGENDTGYRIHRSTVHR